MPLDRLWIAAKLGLFAAFAGGLMLAAPPLVSADAPSAPTARPAPERAAAQAPAPAQPANPRFGGMEIVSELDIPHWLRPGEYAWNPEGAPQRGPTVIVVNIRGRVLSVYRAGVEIGRSSLIYGADNKPTPHGTFPILEKDEDHWSNLYDAPMPHMLRLTWDGVAIHGSPELADDIGTHGCIGLPREFAALLFDVARVGDRVLVWNGTNRSQPI
ncbi:L,D-transpeptidase family protein [Sphingosinicella sp. LHD-64]|uniref:L,D-transpeptidase family protein n=1 Tax=Sphingosinicella sp. LHD-64 TaxID=3072139 RepID=UPI00280CB2E6|nr:L,D-transpeptidase family protein [Sphingosinicella sp. LHD-64]MDQ8756783.1 L,D-transpeptidase family protein [Sphingosinicella sp. LHD-64]